MKRRMLILLLAAACLLLAACRQEAENLTVPWTAAPEPQPEAPAEPSEPVAAALPEPPSEPEAPPAPEAPPESETPPKPETPPEKPTPDPATEALRAALEAELATCTGHWALYWRCLETGETISLGSAPMPAASLIKLFVAGAYCEALEAGELEAAPELLRAMLSDSSNEACNELIDRLGGGDTAAGMERVNAFAAAMGCEDSQLSRKMLAPSPPENYTSVEDCGTVLARIYEGSCVSQTASAELLACLRAQSRTWKIPAGVPDGVETANKTGELAGVENDAAIVWAPGCTYVLCVMSEEILSSSAGQSNIVGLSKMVYEHVTAGEAS